MARTIALLVGSLRKDSFTRKVAHAIVAVTPKLAFQHIDISKLSPYNQDLDATPPPADWVALRDAIRPLDGVLFATPEYNRSVPGLLKNAIDVGSRPYGHSVFAGKPGAVVSVSPGSLGGFGANHHLRQMLVFLDVPCLQQPEMYINNASKIFDDDGKPTDALSALFTTFGAAFTAWVEHMTQR